MTEDEAFARLVAGHKAAGISVSKRLSGGYDVYVKDGEADTQADILGPYKRKAEADEAALEAYLRRLAKAVAG